MPSRLTEILYRHRLSSPASWVALALTTALLIWIASKLVWLLLQWNEPLPEALPMLASASSNAPPTASLSKWHLFGNAAPIEDGRALANAPATQLQLTLLGVWAGKDPQRGRAIIADAAGVEASVAVGREVAPGVILDQVLPDRVVLLRAGAPEVLRLLRDGVSSAASGATSAASKPGFAASAGIVTATGPIGITLPEGAIGAPNLPLQGVDMEAVRKQLGADPYDLAQNITTTPVMEGGKMVGVRLFSAKYAGTLAKLGLQGDDVVTAINGVEVGDPGRIATVIANLQNTRSLSVSVRRNGKTENLSVDLN